MKKLKRYLNIIVKYEKSKKSEKKVKKSHKTDLTVEIKQKCSKVIFLKRKAVLCSSVDCDVMERGREGLSQPDHVSLPTTKYDECAAADSRGQRSVTKVKSLVTIAMRTVCSQ